MSDENDSWLSGIGIDVKGILGTVQEKGAALVDEVKSKGAAAFEEAKGAVSTATAAVTGAAPPPKPAAAPAPKPAAPTGAPSANGSSVSSLKGSVGAGGKNNPDDVKAVQTALKIDADGKCGPATIAAIKAFQTSIGQAKPDGRVDTGGATSRALAGRGGGGAAPPTPAPASNVTPPSPTPDGEENDGFLGGLKKKIVGAVEGTAGAVKDLGGQLLQDQNPQGLPGSARAAFGAPIKVPKFSTPLLPTEEAKCRKFLTDHDFKAVPNLIKPGEFVPALDGRPTTIDAVVGRLGPLTLLNPVDALRGFVLAHYTLLESDARKPRIQVGDVLAPARLIARAGQGSVQLLWKGVKGVPSYNVYRSEVSGDLGGRPLRIVSATTFTDTGVTNGITYHYHVTAKLADGGESASSPQASATPQAADATKAETKIDPKKGVVKSKVKWAVDFTEGGARSPIHSAEIETQVDEVGNADSVEAQLNIIEAQIQRKLNKSGKITLTASVALVAKGALGPDLFESAKAEVKGEVELKLNRIILKAQASVSPDGKVEPSFAIVIWKF